MRPSTKRAAEVGLGAAREITLHASHPRLPRTEAQGCTGRFRRVHAPQRPPIKHNTLGNRRSGPGGKSRMPLNRPPLM